MSAVPRARLNSGALVPALAFGTATRHRQKPCTEYVLVALKAGFRHIDTAELYNNQSSVGDALAQWDGKREDVYITTKWGKLDRSLPNDPRAALQEALKQMKIDYVDLYLIHDSANIHPYTLAEAWGLMEQLQSEGLCKDIGVSNFGARDLDELSESWKVVPAMNQIELSPHCAHDPRTQAIIAKCKQHQITLMPFSALTPIWVKSDKGYNPFTETPGEGPDKTMEERPLDPILEKIGKARGMSESQVLLAWSWQVFGGPIATTSDKTWRMEEYLQTFDHPPLSQEDLDLITEVGKKKYYRRYPNECHD
ncbi:hypothetical protein IAT40_001081 [Kwoniella sp. CBS 6097]